MACYHPLTAWRTDHGEILFHDRGNGDELTLPCGRCIGCRLERSRQWATRIMFESQLHESSCFITLTYDSEHLPYPPSLDYSHFQLFMKRLRDRIDCKIRFFMCGEYGDEHRRPHYHAVIFGYGFPDRVLHSRSRSGFNIYRSPLLESVWRYGYSSVAELSFESAAYVARYSLKKVTGDLAESHYAFTCPETGEVSQLTPEFGRMSLRPGIGGDWYTRFKDDLSHDYVVVNGHRCKPPRYFDKLFERVAPLDFAEVKALRAFDASARRKDNTDARLAVRERVQIARLSSFSPRGVDL